MEVVKGEGEGEAMDEGVDFVPRWVSITIAQTIQLTLYGLANRNRIHNIFGCDSLSTGPRHVLSSFFFHSKRDRKLRNGGASAHASSS